MLVVNHYYSGSHCCVDEEKNPYEILSNEVVHKTMDDVVTIDDVDTHATGVFYRNPLNTKREQLF